MDTNCVLSGKYTGMKINYDSNTHMAWIGNDKTAFLSTNVAKLEKLNQEAAVFGLVKPVTSGPIYDYTVKVYWKDGTFSIIKVTDALYSDILVTSTRTSVPQGTTTSGCYVATCVYGSYDCPQVWTLRRYRDDTLGATWYGRAFVRTYYAISPTLVKWFGKTKWFKKLWQGKLDRMVKKLNDKGVENTPYQDKQW